MKPINYYLLLFFFLFFQCSFAQTKKPPIKNLDYEKQGEQLLITYDLKQDNFSKKNNIIPSYNVQVAITTSFGIINPQHISGDIKNVTPGIQKKILWDIFQDVDELDIEEVRLFLSYDAATNAKVKRIQGAKADLNARQRDAYNKEKYKNQSVFAKHSPGIAVLASAILPGAGQLYNREIPKALTLLLIGVPSGVITGYGDPEETSTQVAALVFLGSWIYGMVDAGIVANKLKKQHALSKRKPLFDNKYLNADLQPYFSLITPTPSTPLQTIQPTIGGQLTISLK